MRIGLRLILLTIAILAIAGIGFFMFTSTLSSPTTLDLYLPKDSEKDTLDQHTSARTKLTLILLKDDKIYGYYGDSIKEGRSVPRSDAGKLITEGFKMFSKDSLIVLIKPAKEASYKATVDMLDQMTINKIEKYSMTDLTKQEKEFLRIAE